ncbi:MAG: nitrilase-related carbon-nitrogen hydrolase [Candidatus Aminicenantales bacterium]
MKIALAQISPCLGDIKKNYELHLHYIEKAKKEKICLLIFPELSLTGYSLQDLVEAVALNPDRSPLFKELKSISREISLVLGFVEEKSHEKGLFYNSAVFLTKGKISHIHRKVFLPTFGMFEEGKFFTEGKNFHTFSTPFGNAGMMICRDFLHYGASYLLFAGGSEMIIVISAAPGRGLSEKKGFASSRMWELMGETISRFSTAFVIYCNRVGIEDGKVFAGGSFIFDPRGSLVAKASYFEQDFLVQEIQPEDIRKARKLWPFKRDDKPEAILEALQRIVHRYED